MRYVLLFLFLSFAKLSFTQEGVLKTKKTTYNRIGIYTGFSLFESTSHVTNYFSLTPFVLWDPLISFKHKRHEFVGGPIAIPSPYYSSTFISGGTLSYLYHFGKRKTHLFAEGNIKNNWYTTNENMRIIPYNKSNSPDGSGMSDAKIMVLAAHVALGFELKIFNFLSLQIACGPGYYWVKPKPGIQIPIPNYPNHYDPNDVYGKTTKDNFYKSHFGFDWYARIGLAWRIYNF